MIVLKKLLSISGAIGIAITAAFLAFFTVQREKYFPGRYEDVFATGFYVLAAWAGYGFICAIFFVLQALIDSRHR